ncbi:MAG: Holliday junction DNA helicase RuvB C-terminal domain-containing protein, partial [Tagaea sp.]
EQRDTIEDVIEPFLIQEGLLLRTPRGRVLGDKGWTHLGLKAPAGAQAALELGRGELGRAEDDA